MWGVFFFFMANPCVCFSVLIGKVFSVRMQKEKKKKSKQALSWLWACRSAAGDAAVTLLRYCWKPELEGTALQGEEECAMDRRKTRCSVLPLRWRREPAWAVLGTFTRSGRSSRPTQRCPSAGSRPRPWPLAVRRPRHGSSIPRHPKAEAQPLSRSAAERRCDESPVRAGAGGGDDDDTDCTPSRGSAVCLRASRCGFACECAAFLGGLGRAGKNPVHSGRRTTQQAARTFLYRIGQSTLTWAMLRHWGSLLYRRVILIDPDCSSVSGDSVGATPTPTNSNVTVPVGSALTASGRLRAALYPKGKAVPKHATASAFLPREGRDARSHAAPCLTDLHRAISSSCGFFPIQHLGGKCGTPGTQLQPAHTLIARSRAFRLHIPSSRTALWPSLLLCVPRGSQRQSAVPAESTPGDR